jgi:hypothetical protein
MDDDGRNWRTEFARPLLSILYELGGGLLPEALRHSPNRQHKKTMIKLNVPYSEKDQAKLLGARWDHELRTWYVPEGMLVSSFESWLPAFELMAKKDNRAVKAYPSKPEKKNILQIKDWKITTGVKYFDLKHNCNPWEYCVTCKPKIITAGWN